MADELEGRQGDKTSVATKETSVEERIKAAEQKGRSDALAEVGRLKQTNTQILARLDKMVKDAEEAEAERYKDDPAELTRIRAEHKAKRLETELAAEREARTELDNRLKQTDAEKAEYTKQQIAREIATRLNVDVGKLTKLAKFTDGTAEAIEDIAKDLPKITAHSTEPPDSNKGAGGSPPKKLSELLAVNTKGMTLKQLEEHRKAIMDARNNPS